MILKNEGYELMGAAFEVYNQLGYGMSEDVYQESLEIELELRQIPFHVKKQIPVYYKKRRLRAVYVPDLFVHEKICVELKAAKEFSSEHESQLFNYMRISRMSVGYLINFGHSGDLQWKRYILTDHHEPPEQ